MLILESIINSPDRSKVQVRPEGLAILPQAPEVPFTFITRPGFCTLTLACMLDSLVRVTRRVDRGHFVSIPGALVVELIESPRTKKAQLCCTLKRSR